MGSSLFVDQGDDFFERNDQFREIVLEHRVEPVIINRTVFVR